MFKNNKLGRTISLILAVAMMMMAFAVPSFATDAVVMSDATLIGSTPYAGAKNFAPGSSTSVQPIRLAFSTGADVIGANASAYVSILDTYGDAIDVTASVSGNIVTLMPDAALGNSATYTVDFEQTYLPNVADFTFTTSKGGTGTGTGSGSGGGTGTQALVLTGKIPTNGAYVAASQTMYFTFSNNINATTTNAAHIYVKDAAGVKIVSSATITDSWTAVLSTSNLASGNYTVVIEGALAAKNGTTLGSTDVEIPFYVA